MTVPELLGKIDERVRIYEQVGKSQEKIKVVLICYLNEGQCWTDRVCSEYVFTLQIGVIIILFPVWAGIKHVRLIFVVCLLFLTEK